ncbi:hypothetical protein JHK82_023279 [Glycine max]|nr:hypothetical protein JHK85_023813 [Glycine max]KAG5138548.1 hypothetical protein JHK82_023279 [Glycine max]
MSRSSTQACAACKYQRRKCGSNCILAPYFPHDRQKQFLNAHRLFGVGKITNMIKPLDQHHRDLAMSTLIYESDMRARDPIGGCYSLVLQLQSQIFYATQQLHLLLQHLAYFKSHQPSSSNSSDIVNNVTPQPPDPLEQTPQEQQQQQQCFNYNLLQEDDINMSYAGAGGLEMVKQNLSLPLGTYTVCTVKLCGCYWFRRLMPCPLPIIAVVLGSQQRMAVSSSS